jgi:hypothetical protein
VGDPEGPHHEHRRHGHAALAGSAGHARHRLSLLRRGQPRRRRGSRRRRVGDPVRAPDGAPLRDDRGRARARRRGRHARGAARVRAHPRLGPPRLVHLQDRPGRRPDGRPRRALPRARNAKPAGGRRLGLPAHPGLLHRHPDVHEQ